MMRSLGARVLFALIVGLAAGIAISGSGSTALARLVDWIEPIGTIWINAIRMTVVPLVVAVIVVGIGATPDLKSVGSFGGRAVAVFILLLAVAASLTVAVAHPILSYLSIDPAGAQALRAGAAQASASIVEGAQRMQSLRSWFVDIVPVNPVKAAADGAMLPLILFSVVFGIAMTRVGSQVRETFLNVAHAVMDACLVLVHWILAVAPIGVFALSLTIGLRLGLAAAGAVVFYIAVVAGACTAFVTLLYFGVWLSARRRSGAFPRFWAPAQAVAFSSRSSLAALPAMIEASETMRQPLVIRSFFLPLAVTTFRLGAAINIPIGVLFLARLYGVDVSAAQLAAIALTSVVTTFSVPGIPGGSIIVMVPVLLAADLPVEGIGILLGVDTLPDMFRTTTNVTGDLAVASILSRDSTPAADLRVV